MARISQDYIDRLNAATDLEMVVGEYVKLKRSGGELLGLCPFHSESTPSFSVNTEKNVFLCRGCGEAGTPTMFLTKVSGMSFHEAVEKLSQAAGMPIPAPEHNARESAAHAHQQALLGVISEARGHYREALKASPEAQAYLAKRGVTHAMIERFGIGFAPHNTFLSEKMPHVAPALLKEAGLIYESQFNPGEVRDQMVRRVIFPIQNTSGKTVAFGGRALARDAKRKYLNTPETPLFKKGSELYGWFEAANAIRKSKTVIVTEGYLDVVVPSGNGIQPVVSAMGTTLSAATLVRLFGQAEHIQFCFDADTAGRRAALKMLETIAPLVDDTHKASFALLPEGFDPDDYVLKHGTEGFEKFMREAAPLSKYMINEFSQRNDMTSAEGRARFAVETMAIVNATRAPTYQALLKNEVRKVVGPDIPLPAAGSLPVSGPRAPMPMSAPAPIASMARRGRLPQGAPELMPPVVQAGLKQPLAVQFLAAILRDPTVLSVLDVESLRAAAVEKADIEILILAAEHARRAPDTEHLVASLRGTVAESMVDRALEGRANANELLGVSNVLGFMQEVVNAERRRLEGQNPDEKSTGTLERFGVRGADMRKIAGVSPFSAEPS